MPSKDFLKMTDLLRCAYVSRLAEVFLTTNSVILSPDGRGGGVSGQKNSILYCTQLLNSFIAFIVAGRIFDNHISTMRYLFSNFGPQ